MPHVLPDVSGCLLTSVTAAAHHIVMCHKRGSSVDLGQCESAFETDREVAAACEVPSSLWPYLPL